MSVAFEDLIEPKGPLQHSMFPHDTAEEFQTRVGAYIKDGAERVAAFLTANGATLADRDPAIKAWALYRGFSARFIALSNDPATAGVTDTGTRTYLQQQIAAFEARAKEYLGEYEALVTATLDLEGETRDYPQGTQAVPTTFSIF